MEAATNKLTPAPLPPILPLPDRRILARVPAGESGAAARRAAAAAAARWVRRGGEKRCHVFVCVCSRSLSVCVFGCNPPRARKGIRRNYTRGVVVGGVLCASPLARRRRVRLTPPPPFLRAGGAGLGAPGGQDRAGAWSPAASPTRTRWPTRVGEDAPGAFHKTSPVKGRALFQGGAETGDRPV